MTTSIRSLYTYALAEGEGVGTAYEYFVKRGVLRSVLAETPRGGSILVAGLPEKYGTSLDFVLAAAEKSAKVRVMDDRPAALDRARGAFAALDKQNVEIDYRQIDAMTNLGDDAYDLALSCEVVQRLAAGDRERYVRSLRDRAPRGVIFCPNGENESHTKISGLSGLTQAELARLAGTGAEVGFVDMPPFPPGITRSAEQRSKASTGLAEGIAMWGLQAYALAEPFAPRALKRHVAHIVYAKWES